MSEQRMVSASIKISKKVGDDYYSFGTEVNVDPTGDVAEQIKQNKRALKKVFESLYAFVDDQMQREVASAEED